MVFFSAMFIVIMEIIISIKIPQTPTIYFLTLINRVINN